MIVPSYPLSGSGEGWDVKELYPMSYEEISFRKKLASLLLVDISDLDIISKRTVSHWSHEGGLPENKVSELKTA